MLRDQLRGPYDAALVTRALRWWAKLPTSLVRQRRLFDALLPLLGREMRKWTTPEHAAREDFEAEAASALWESIAKCRTYDLVTSRGKLSSRNFRAVVAQGRRALWGKSDQLRRPDDVGEARRRWMEGLAVSYDPNRALDLLLLKELPESVLQRVLAESRLRAPKDQEALRFFVRRLLRLHEGQLVDSLREADVRLVRQRVQRYAQNVIGLPLDRARFVFDYAVVKARQVLLDHHSQYRELVISPPPPVVFERRAVGC